MSPDSSTQSSAPLEGALADVHADNHIDPPVSHVWIWFLLGMLGFLFIRALRHRSALLRRGIEADEAFDKHAALAPGMRYVYGRVELAEGCDSAVSVHVEQHGTETKNKNSWSHRWTETGRETHAKPFYVRTPRGERVRVEPGTDVLLVDDPDGMIWTERTTRTRIATLSLKEEVIVEGTLDRGHDPELREAALYRGSAQGWVMRPIAGGRMHISAEKLGERHRKRAQVFRSAAVAIAIMAGLVSLLSGCYMGSLFLGTDTTVNVTDKRHYTTKGSKGSTTHHYEVTLKLRGPDAPQMRRELDSSDWAGITPGMTIAYRDVPAWRTLGDPGWGASIHVLLAILSGVAAFVGLAFFTGAISHKEWYDGRLDDQGSGRLPDPPQQKK